MNDIMRDVTAIATAIIGLAIVAVLIRNGRDTARVIGAATSGFGTDLLAASSGGVGGVSIPHNYGG